MSKDTQKLETIQEAMPPILTEVKVMFLQYLSYGLTIQERQIRMIALNHACEAVKKFSPERFLYDE